MKMCEMMSEMRQSDWDKDIFLINCWDNVVGVLELFGECVGGRREEVERMLEERVGSLVGEHVEFFLFLFFVMVEKILIKDGVSINTY